MKFLLLSTLLLCLKASCVLAAATDNPPVVPPTPPVQPASGPGGAEYKHQGVIMTAHADGPQGYWLFEPSDPKPAQAPVIVFSHGWGGIQPEIYGAWIKHLVKRGNIVIYPAYQDHLTTPAGTFTANAVAGVTQALHELQDKPGHVKPDLDKFALAGHSLGGVLSVNLAAAWEKNSLPKPRAVMCVEPGGMAAAPLEDMSKLPKETLLLMVVGDHDSVVGKNEAKGIFHEAMGIEPPNRNFVVLVSDNHGQPALLADHFAPLAPATFSDESFHETSDTTMLRQMVERGAGPRGKGLEGVAFDKNPLFPIDALDYFGTWKLLDGLTDAAFYGQGRKYALGGTPEQRFMGLWSDGVPVKSLLIVDAP